MVNQSTLSDSPASAEIEVDTPSVYDVSPAPMYDIGDEVTYKPVGGPTSHTSTSIGTITKVLTQPGRAAGRNVNASEEDPRYEILNNHTQKKSAMYEKNVLGRVSDGVLP
ncbi:hypothetical protein EJ06DRAFT_532743 [Trichodelitschia bisporula]|uniref:Hypervirulence associated protein TUDOR domain-containing protein n=1 Tax=Trichodelitschia bisporula TaxID=703511 RepID=A0A6G1HP34_9PEZI|nr:hypothetical protein EJ06DRAFT_532743 [Trichodelitschia bisporula]